MTEPTVESMLQSRGKTHGSFVDHAGLTQGLKSVFFSSEHNQNVLTFEPTQRESIEMIFHKLGRIGAGDPNFIDHWEDIAGYAMLVAKIQKMRQINAK